MPVCHTVHGPLTGEPGDVYSLIDRVSPSVALISVSDHQRTPLPDINWLATCHNAIAMDAYPFKDADDGYLLFLGRMSPDKGAHNAVRVAAEMGLPMILAGKMHDVAEREHFEANVEPFLSDDIRYVGEVSHDEKVRLLQRARATVFPIQWPEPFGLVMVESMACGTPVVATRFGAVPEVIEQGRSGVIVDEFSELAAGVEQALSLDPAECRASAVERFSPQADDRGLRGGIPPTCGRTDVEWRVHRAPAPDHISVFLRCRRAAALGAARVAPAGAGDGRAGAGAVRGARAGRRAGARAGRRCGARAGRRGGARAERAAPSEDEPSRCRWSTCRTRTWSRRRRRDEDVVAPSAQGENGKGRMAEMAELRAEIVERVERRPLFVMAEERNVPYFRLFFMTKLELLEAILEVEHVPPHDVLPSQEALDRVREIAAEAYRRDTEESSAGRGSWSWAGARPRA